MTTAQHDTIKGLLTQARNLCRHPGARFALSKIGTILDAIEREKKNG